MKFAAIVFFGLFLSTSAFSSSDKKCSSENLEKVVAFAAKIIGEQSLDDTKVFKAVMQKKSTAKEIRQSLLAIKKSSKVPSASIELGKFLDAHPECDRQKLFSVRVTE